MLYQQVARSVSTAKASMQRLMSSFEFWHSLVASASRGYLSAQDPSRMPGQFAWSASQVKPGAKPMKFRPLHDRIVIRRIDGPHGPLTPYGAFLSKCFRSFVAS